MWETNGSGSNSNWGEAEYFSPWQGKGWSLTGGGCAAGGGNSSSNGCEYSNPRGVAVDGAGLAWFASAGGGNDVNGSLIGPGVLAVNTSTTSGAGAGSCGTSNLANGPLRVAVDGSGNVWVLLANNTVTECLSVATPVVTPIALGVKNKKLAAKP
jgi:hypothetical protein